MAKQKTKKINITVKKLNVMLPNNEPVKVDMSADELFKLALNTSIKNSKTKK